MAASRSRGGLREQKVIEIVQEVQQKKPIQKIGRYLEGTQNTERRKNLTESKKISTIETY